MKKIKVGIIFGGKSSEHEVSLMSAKNIIYAIDKNKYQIVLLGIDKNGNWNYYDMKNYLLNENDPKKIKLNRPLKALQMDFSKTNVQKPFDVAFPVLHGLNGEDGTVQGFLKLFGIPFVGANVLGSAIGMDKDVSKRLLRDANIPIAKFLTFRKNEQISFPKIKKELGFPFFIKPANAGSSVGVNKIKDQKLFKKAIDDAFMHDSKILAEEYIRGREIECSVLGNNEAIASIPGEIVSLHEFYSYEAKYLDENGAKLIYPAKLSRKIIKNVQDLATKTYKVLELKGMARVDFFLRVNGKLFVNEVNTIPGFTKISMYPKLWEISGLSYTKLIDQLINLALKSN
jgi:D-alanine-D-alanine ligase